MKRLPALFLLVVTSFSAWGEPSPFTPQELFDKVLEAHGGRQAILQLTCVKETGHAGEKPTDTFTYWWTPTAQRVDWRIAGNHQTKVRRADGAHWWREWHGWTAPDVPLATYDTVGHGFLYFLHLLTREPRALPIASLTFQKPYHLLTLTHLREAPIVLKIRDGSFHLDRFQTASGDRPDETRFDDWRPVGGLRLPFKHVTNGAVDQTETLVLNDPWTDDPFARPPAGETRTLGTLPVTLTLAADDEDHWFVPVGIGDPSPAGWLMVDTGANFSNIAEEAVPAGTQRMNVDGSSAAVTGQTAKFSSLVRLSALHLGGLTVFDWWASSHSAARFQILSSRRRVIGLLGADFFARFLVKLDPPRHQMIIYPASASPAMTGLEWHPLKFYEGIPHLDVTLNGYPARFALDTGAASNKIRTSFPFPKGFRAETGSPVLNTQVAGFDGASQGAHMGLLHTLGFGPHALHQPVFQQSHWEGSASDGLLGYGVYKPLVTWWDHPHGRIGFERAASPVSHTLRHFWYDYQEYVKFSQQRQWTQALDLVHALRARYPERIDLLAEHEMYCLKALKRGDELEGVFLQLIKDAGDRPGLYALLAGHYLDLNQGANALKAARRALALGYPADGILILQIQWRAHEMLQEYDRALPLVERAHAWYPWLPVTRQGMASVNKSLKRYDVAIPHFEKLVTPKWPTSFVNLAGVYTLAGRTEDAFNVLQRLKATIRTPEGERWWTTVANVPDLAPLKSDPRWTALFPAPK